MAIRYSGNAELRILFDGKDSYRVVLRHPGGIRMEGSLTRREVGITRKQDPRSSETYDQIARHVLVEAKKACARQLGLEMQLIEQGDRVVVQRVFQAPCPIV